MNTNARPLPILVFALFTAITNPLSAEDLGLTNIPEGYNLQAYDDCGVAGHQPHVHGENVHTFAPGTVQANERARSVTFGSPNFDMTFDDLRSDAPYVLAVTYASEKNNRRVQRLSAGSVLLHEPRTLPDGKAERLIFKVPQRAINAGKLTLHFVLLQGPNAVVSEVELWAPLPSPEKLYLDVTPLLSGRLEGFVSDLRFNGLADIPVEIREQAGVWHETIPSQTNGLFDLDIASRIKLPANGYLKVITRYKSLEAAQTISLSDLSMELPHFRPIATKVGGIKNCALKLDGSWKIHPRPPENFQKMPSETNGWSRFIVPGQWLQQGFDIPRDQRVGVATRFSISKSWVGQRIFLRCEAVHGGAQYWLNGHFLGSSENLETPVEFDVTEAAHIGADNFLALAIKVQTSSEALAFTSDYAFHNLGGIDRSVYLFALPPVHLSNLHYETSLNEIDENAVLVLNGRIANAGSFLATNLFLHVALASEKGSQVLNDSRFALELDNDNKFSLKIPVTKPRLWNAEKPFLYKLTARLSQGKIFLEQLEENVGFRKIEVRDSQFFINGARVKLAGVNRHEIDPLSGRAATAIHADDDARLLHDANFNFIRTSHYPPTREFLEACDRRGLYVEVEAPFCWTRGGRGEDDPRQTKNFLLPTAAMLDFCRDHPCVILWSIGNESGNGPDGTNLLPQNFSASLDLCHREDKTRPVIFNNEWTRDGGACDIACLHYPPIPVENFEFIKKEPRLRPILIDEYFPPQTFVFAEELKINPGLDIVNWSTGQNSTNSWWCQLFNSSRVIGGSIWAGIDEEFFFRNGDVKGYGPWGFIDVWRRRKSLWWDTKRIHSPVWIPTRHLDLPTGSAGNIVRVPLENRFSFTDLSELNVIAEIGHWKKNCQAALRPMCKGEMEVPLPRNTTNGSLLVLRFFDAQKNLITAHGLTLGKAPAPLIPKLQSGRPQWEQTPQSIHVHGNQFAFTIDRASGLIVNASSNIALRELPSLHVTRREDKNPFNPNGLPFARYPDESTRVIDSLSAEERADGLAVVVRDHYKNFQGKVELVFDSSGAALISFHYSFAGEAFNVAEAGLRFTLDDRCDEISWRRRTEWDVYPEDHIGRAEGHAPAHASERWQQTPRPPYLKAPSWLWHLDENEMGTRDFRATKYNIYEAALRAPNGGGLQVISDGSANVRSCLAKGDVQLHTLLAAPPPQLARSNQLSGSFFVRLAKSGPARN